MLVPIIAIGIAFILLTALTICVLWMIYKNNYKTYTEWLKYRKSKDNYFFVVKVDKYPLWKQKEFARIRSEEFIKQVPTFETKLNKLKKLEAIKNICKEDI